MMFAGTGVWKSKRGAALLGCRYVFINDEHYGCNVRDELIAADEVSYAYDDIGNRTIAEGKTYTANNLNQYTAIDDFAPQYDDDGNQTLIKTETGIWSVVYNAENRPIRWTQGDTVITMVFDRMGRRIEMRTQSADSGLLQRFVYDNYLCVQQLRGADNALFHSYVWDPTEPIATRPLIFLPAASSLAYYFHDGNKNVSDLVDAHGSVVHYDYMAFGSSTSTAFSENPYRFSSEVYDDGLGLVYYNYRHYNPQNGRWLSLDPLQELGGINLYNFAKNQMSADYLGLSIWDDIKEFVNDTVNGATKMVDATWEFTKEQIVAAGEFIKSKYKTSKEQIEAVYAYTKIVLEQTITASLNKMAKLGAPCGSGPSAIFVPNGLFALLVEIDISLKNINVGSGVIWVDFSSCCLAHDDCYVENCKKAKECEKNRDKLKQDCDTALGTCIKNTYEAKLGFNLQGYAIGGIYQNAVGFFGDKAFDQACEGK